MRQAADESENDGLRTAISRLVGDSSVYAQGPMIWEPAFDIQQNAHEICFWVDLPGVEEDEIVIHADATCLQIRASREFDHDCEDAEEFSKLGRPYGVFSCKATLPDHADPDGMTAKYKRGVLKVRIPRNHG